MPEVSEMVWNDFFSHFSLNADGSRSYDGVQVKRNAVFADAKGHWAQDAIENTVAEGLFSGVTDTSFAPNTSATRGMLMTVLARYAGTDTTGGATWYEKGMEWAKTNGVSDGTNPNADITREQLVTMLYRYAGSPKADGKLDSFSDFASVSSYAENAMQWAVANGIVNGSNGKLNPQNNATRAEVAAILMRFCEMSK
ncbi:MAG: S-layer homology domain-containing protein [Butyricicoccus sp.]